MSDSPEQIWLEGFISAHGGVAGTMHRIDAEVLRLCAALNIPPPVRAATETIVRGKGMAGLAWERQRPVQTCNLKTDETGDVRPGARAVDAHAAVALPVFAADRQVRAVVGIAFGDSRELSEQELETLSDAAQRCPDAG